VSIEHNIVCIKLLTKRSMTGLCHQMADILKRLQDYADPNDSMMITYVLNAVCSELVVVAGPSWGTDTDVD
jgi:hypothetical protein